MSNHIHLILGGARSGKSRFAENHVQTICEEQGLRKVYVATATALDAEMCDRIEHHQAGRDDRWSLIEEPCDLASVLKSAKPTECLLIECLTLWVSNCLYHENWPEHRLAFLNALEKTLAAVVMVSNEVGQGIIPSNPLSRQFVDESGRLHQALAAKSDRVSFVVAGLAQTLKSG